MRFHTASVEVRVDGAKVPADDRRLVDTDGTRAGILHLVIPRRDSKVSVIAYNANGASEPASVHVEWRGPGTEPKLTLYVLAIGISNYKDKKVQLHFAAKDADDFVALAKAQEGGLYEKVIAHPPKGSLRDDEAIREAVLDELDWIMRAVTNTNDVAMVFLSGHVITTPDQHYRFLPYDYDSGRVERTTISDSELRDYLTKLGGKKTSSIPAIPALSCQARQRTRRRTWTNSRTILRRVRRRAAQSFHDGLSESAIVPLIPFKR